MSNGYLVAAGPDLEVAHEISEGFGLDVIDAASAGDAATAASALGAAANVGILLSSAAAQDDGFVALLRGLAAQLQRAQLILVDDVRASFSFLPEAWPAMSIDEARARAADLVRRREAPASTDTERAAPLPPPEPGVEAAPPVAEQAAPEVSAEPETQHEAAVAPAEEAEPSPPEESEAAPESVHAETNSLTEEAGEPVAHQDESPLAEPQHEPMQESADREEAPPAPQDEAPVPAAPPQMQPAPMPSAPPATANAGAAPKSRSARDTSTAITAPADATAFAPKKLRRGTPELIQVAVHQPKDLKEVIKRVRKADPTASDAGNPVAMGDVGLGASIGVALEVHGAECDGKMQRQVWRGEPLLFPFSATLDDGAKQATFQARVFIGDAQVGVIGFTRNPSSPKKKPADSGNGERMKRHKRVFLSYSSHDRETVAAIATAYEAAGVPHFWDRASLKSGEEWSPRLRKEIDRADLFHLCWSKAASSSQWVEKETEHALTRRKRSKGKNPDITVQMLDGPPWAPHPTQLDSINFDDFVRAAIVGYARGEG